MTNSILSSKQKKNSQTKGDEIYQNSQQIKTEVSVK